MKSETLKDLPENVARFLSGFVESAHDAFGDSLRSVVLYGSGAEGKLRPASDVNLLLVVSDFDQKQADALREPYRQAQAAIRLAVMFLLESEVQPAAVAFAEKFGDIARRRRILYGEDPFKSVTISRADSIARLKQALLNLTLRLREAYIARGLREEQLAHMIADAAGPLRSCAATLLDLEGRPAESAKEALAQVASSMAASPRQAEAISLISEARQKGALAPGQAAPTLFYLIELARNMWLRAGKLS